MARRPELILQEITALENNKLTLRIDCKRVLRKASR
jgi:hypothetical protein